MTVDEARRVLQEALLHVNFINFGSTLAALAEGHSWKTFDNSKWRPEKLRALQDSKWLAENADQIELALKTFYVNR